MAWGDYKQNRQDAQDEVLSYWNVEPTQRDNMVKVLEDNSAVFAASIHRIAYNTGHTFKEVSDLVMLFARQGMSFHKVLRLTEDALNCIGPIPTVANMAQIKRDVEAFQELKAANIRHNNNEPEPALPKGRGITMAEFVRMVEEAKRPGNSLYEFGRLNCLPQ